MVVVRGSRPMVVVGRAVAVIIVPRSGDRSGVAVIVMAGSLDMVIVPMDCGGRMGRVVVVTMPGVVTVTGVWAVVVMSGGLAMTIVPMDCGGRMGRVVVVTMPGVVAVTGLWAVVVVRLVLVAHCDSFPQPLSAVIAAKSV